MIGQTLSNFKITGKLGEGGVGVVYQAEDTKLGRDVAIRVLPESMIEDPDRLARFEREAEVLAALEHVNIAAVFGLEEVDGRQLLVMQLAEGETLRERIARGPIPIEQALPIALQIAEALEAAHEKGIVHCDLKPGNVKVSAEGQVKVLDFGLTKALGEEREQGDVDNPPGLAAAATQAGSIMGTAGYLSPEQVAGKMGDHRSDVWSFGVVLAEMITGKRQFGGETNSQVMAAVMQKDPDWDHFATDLPRSILLLLKRCLHKNPKHRLQAIGDARVLLQRYLADTAASKVEIKKKPVWKTALPWALFAFAVIGASLLILWPEAPPQVLESTIPPPENTGFHLNTFNPGPAVISPDGTKLTFSTTDADGVFRLYVRSLGATETHLLPGTDGAQFPFWSPDSRWIGFFTRVDEKLKKIDSSGGSPVTLCDAANGKGGAWSREGVILFTPDYYTPIHRVSAAGGESVSITEIDTEHHNSHRYPRFLPDGTHFLFLARGAGSEPSSIRVGSLDGGEVRKIVETPVQAEFASGYLLFVRESTLMARAFDPKSLEFTGEAVPLAEDVRRIMGASLAVFSSSEDGLLLFQTGSAAAETALEWRDRDGQVDGSLGEPAAVRLAVLSPDDTMAAVVLVDDSGAYDIWLQNIESNLRTRFTFDPGDDHWPVWSSDSQYLYFTSGRRGNLDIYRKAVTGVGEVELVFDSETDKMLTGISPDGRYLTYFEYHPETQNDLYVLPLEGESEPIPYRKTEFNEGLGMISPDGRWMAYASDDSGVFQIYATTFPEPGRRWQISTNSGLNCFWRGDGREIIYTEITGDLVSVEVDHTGKAFRIGESRSLFGVSPAGSEAWFSISSDAERILVVPNLSPQGGEQLNLVVNWPKDLEQSR